MDRLEQYRTDIKRILREHQTYASPEPGIEKRVVADDAGGHYVLLEIGWENLRRLAQMVIYVRLSNDKIWIEVDWTESGVAQDLLEAGISKDDIVLAFHHPDKRPYTEFAVA
jgi:hypothetical protein